MDKGAADILKKFTKAKLVIASIAAGGFGCLLPLAIFTVFIAVFIVLGLFSSSDDVGNGTGNVSLGSECGFTISATSLSKEEFKSKLVSYTGVNSNFQIFVDYSDDIYDYSLSKNVNPELVVVRAAVEDNGTTSGDNNYWGIGCLNGAGIDACTDFANFTMGYQAFVNNAAQYGSLTEMFAKYAYIGDYWFNPGNSSDGGCYYAPYIYPDNMPDRVKNACGDSAPYCDTGGGSGCTKTTAEDQEAYGRWQIDNNMGEKRKEIFGLATNEGPCANVNGTDTSSSGSLKDKLNEYINNKVTDGTYAIYVKNLTSMSSIDINGSNKMVAASVIKLFVMGTAYDKINKGEISKSTATGGGNTVISDIGIMITESNNDATNRLIDLLEMNTINSYIRSNGYSTTVLNRKMLFSGPENYVTANEVGKFLEKVYNKEVVSSSYSTEMMDFLKGQTRRSKIPAGVPSGVVTANKTGELSNVENDAAIIFAGGDYILVVLTNNLSNTGAAVNHIKSISEIVYNYYTSSNS